MTVVASEAVLFPVAVSPGVETEAELVTAGAAGAATATVRVIALLVAPAASESELVQVTTCPTAEHDQFVPVPETKDKPAGKVSVTVMVPMVGAAPARFDTVIV